MFRRNSYLSNFRLERKYHKIRGKWRTLKSNQSNCEISVLPTFSISHLLNRPDLKKYAWEDMKLLRDSIKEI